MQHLIPSTHFLLSTNFLLPSASLTVSRNTLPASVCLIFTYSFCLCCSVHLPIFSLCLAVHMLFVRIDSSASWLCIMCLSAPHVSCRICQFSSYDLSCTCLNQRALVKKHERNPAAPASLTPPFSSASVLEFGMYSFSVQNESLGLFVIVFLFFADFKNEIDVLIVQGKVGAGLNRTRSK